MKLQVPLLLYLETGPKATFHHYSYNLVWHIIAMASVSVIIIPSLHRCRGRLEDIDCTCPLQRRLQP